MDNQRGTTPRKFRMPDEEWDELGQLTADAETDRSTVLRELARWWMRRPGAKLPKRPAA
jgi:hypothetical protein